MFSVNANEVVKLSTKLERIKKSTLPVTVRQTLNTLAFETKKQIPLFAKRDFVFRTPQFWKAYSSVSMASGFNINRMKSMAGMTDRPKGGKQTQAGENMFQQQTGGVIGGRSFIPMDHARTSRKSSKAVKKENRLSSVSNIVSSKTSKGKNQKQRLIKTSIYVVKKSGKGVVSHSENGNTTIYRVNRGKGAIKIKTREGLIGLTPIYSYVSGRSIKVESKPFVRETAKSVRSNTFSIFEKHAKRQFQKIK